jgi:predicted dehydrogenase
MKTTTLHHLRAGIIGTGFIAPVHVEALRREGVQVTAVCGSREGALAMAERWNITEAYGDYDYEAMLASPNVDVVHITSPNRAHVEQSLAALAAGKHVICEKPLGMNPDETARVVAAARRARRVFAVNYVCRCYPAVLQMRAMVQRGELGRIIHVNGQFFQDWLLKETDYNWRVLASEGGKLRAVGDIGTHWMDTVSFILGSRAREVFASLGTFHKTRMKPEGGSLTFSRRGAARKGVAVKVDTEDYASVLLRYGKSSHGHADGVEASCAVSQVAAGWKCGMMVGIYGSEGSAQWDMRQPNEIQIGRRDQPNQVLQRATAGFDRDVAGFTDYPGGHAEGFADVHKMYYRAVYQSIASGGKSPAVFADAGDGHHEVVLCEALLRSAASGRWERL